MAIISTYQLKPRFQDLLRPAVHTLINMGITANQVTIATMLFSGAMGGAITFWYQNRWPLLALPLFLLIRMALNAIDGMMAREHQMQTPLGMFLNELGDVISDIVLYLPFAAISGISTPMIMLFVLLALISELSGICAVQLGGQRRYDGPMTKSDRALVFGSLGFMLGVGILPGLWANGVLAVVNLLLVCTIFNRVKNALQEASHGN